LKALIAYGTRYGATTGTSEEIAKILREEGFDTKIINLKEEKVKDISEYDLIIVGSGMGNCRWTSEAEDFLKNFRKEFEGKKLALFVSTMITFFEREGKIDDVAKTRKVALEDKIAKYGLKPIASGVFGGVIDYNKMGFIARKGMEFFKPNLKKTGSKRLHQTFMACATGTRFAIGLSNSLVRLHGLSHLFKQAKDTYRVRATLAK